MEGQTVFRGLKTLKIQYFFVILQPALSHIQFIKTNIDLH